MRQENKKITRKPTLKISSIDFVNNVVIIKNKSKNPVTLSFQELDKNKNLISRLTALDAFKLGRFVGDNDVFISEIEKNNS